MGRATLALINVPSSSSPGSRLLAAGLVGDRLAPPQHGCDCAVALAGRGRCSSWWGATRGRTQPRGRPGRLALLEVCRPSGCCGRRTRPVPHSSSGSPCSALAGGRGPAHRDDVRAGVAALALVAVAAGVDRRAVRQQRRRPRLLGRGRPRDRRPGRALWLLPGQTSASYVWSDRRPDDVVQGLYDEREAMVRTTVANSTPQGASLLAGLDRTAAGGQPSPAALAAVSRYLGVGSLVVRSDVDNASVGGADPAVVAVRWRDHRGSRSAHTFGAASEPTAGPTARGCLRPSTTPSGRSRAMQLSALVTVVGDATRRPRPGPARDPRRLAAVPPRCGRRRDRSWAGCSDARQGRPHRHEPAAEAVPNRLTEDRGPPVAADGRR